MIKNNKKNNKGFTIVELVIVIAVIAILASVLIPTFSGIVEKANFSNDIQICKNMNKTLSTDFPKGIYVPDSVLTVQESLTTYKENFTPKTATMGYHYYWNENDNYIYLVYDYESSFEIYFQDENGNVKSQHDEDASKFYRLDNTYYSISSNIEGITLDKKVVEKGSSYVVITLYAAKGYEIPQKVQIDGTMYSVSQDNKIEITGEITDNIVIAELNCFAAGTKITMSDGTLKNIEDITENEKVLTFNHEKGIYEAQEIFLLFHEEYKAIPFTLNFDNGITLSIVGEHDLFIEESLKYVTIDAYNAKDYIGSHFYNVDENNYIELISVVLETEAVDFYTIYTKYNVNCIANGMLSCPVENEDVLNIYEFNHDLSIDHEKLEADILKYGLYEYPENATYPEKYYEAFKMKYVNIMIGKGLVSSDTIFERIAAGIEIE